MKTRFAFTALLILAAPAFAADDFKAAIDSPARTQEDRDRDARDKPAEIMAFAGVKPGMTVLDVFSASGYWTELLAGAVGPNGKVLAINNVPYLQYSKDGIAKRFGDGHLKNVESKVVEASHMYLPPKSADLAIIVMSYHDVFWIDEKEGWPQIDTDGFLKSLKAALKPGGRLLIIDHNAAAGTGKEMAGKLHRLNEDWAKKSLADGGFVFENEYDGLRNKDDQLDKMVFDPAVKGHTDRYVLLYTVK
ncbi:MAG TPA: methyltransferase domain-containing protein [Steroidobacteraceae bacterium]|nr:methyltransferase domain-containing protein [Steroidobacteraceae bacterium]